MTVILALALLAGLIHTLNTLAGAKNAQNEIQRDARLDEYANRE